VLRYFNNVEKKTSHEDKIRKQHLKTLSISHRIDKIKHEKIIKAHKKKQKEWYELREKICKQVGKNNENSVFNRILGFPKNQEIS
jgi:hypothetical protein